MKVVKLVSVLLATASLAGCWIGLAPAPKGMNTFSEKMVTYQCQGNKKLTVVYRFDENGKPLSASPSLHNAVAVLPLDAKNKDFTSFKNELYIWNVDVGLTADNVEKIAGSMLTKIGKESDEILAKECSK